MPSLTSPRRRRPLHTIVLWLLALVLPLQGAAVGVFAAQGAAHVHRAAAEAPLVLEDFRRWKAPAARTHVLSAVGHFHGGAAWQRHHHGRGDAGVVPVAVGEPDGSEAAGSVAGLSLLGLVATEPRRGAAPPRGEAVAHAPWAWCTALAELPDRPPKRG